MNKLNWKNLRPYFIEFLLFLIVVGLAWFGSVFLRNALHNKMDRLQELDVLSENQYQQMASLPDLEKQYEFIQANEEALQNVLLTKDRLVEFIQTLERLASESEVEIKIASQDNTLLESKITSSTTVTKKPGTPSSTEGETLTGSGGKKLTGIMGELPFSSYIRLSITVTGIYPHVVQFLHAMETLPYALDVVKLRMSEHAEDAQKTVADPGINPFNPDGTPKPVLPPKPTILRLDADYETVLYLKK